MEQRTASSASWSHGSAGGYPKTLQHSSLVERSGFPLFTGEESPSRHVMSLCLLSRRLQNSCLSKCDSCFRPSKAMITLLFGSVWLQSTCSTSQPRQQKILWRRLSPSFNPVPEHSITQASASQRGLNTRSSVNGQARYLRHPVEASKTCCVPSSNSPNHVFHPTNKDRLCLVCDTACSASCAVCDQDFCSNHLYLCLDCNNQYCSRCLDDHRADGHWSDSDTAAELTRGHSAAFPGLIVTSNRPLPFCGDHYCCQSGASVVSAPGCPRSRPSQTDTRSPFASLFVLISRFLRSCLSPFLAGPILKLLSQSEIFLEVSF